MASSEWASVPIVKFSTNIPFIVNQSYLRTRLLDSEDKSLTVRGFYTDLVIVELLNQVEPGYYEYHRRNGMEHYNTPTTRTLFLREILGSFRDQLLGQFPILSMVRYKIIFDKFLKSQIELNFTDKYLPIGLHQRTSLLKLHLESKIFVLTFLKFKTCKEHKNRHMLFRTKKKRFTFYFYRHSYVCVALLFRFCRIIV